MLGIMVFAYKLKCLGGGIRMNRSWRLSPPVFQVQSQPELCKDLVTSRHTKSLLDMFSNTTGRQRQVNLFEASLGLQNEFQ